MICFGFGTMFVLGCPKSITGRPRRYLKRSPEAVKMGLHRDPIRPSTPMARSSRLTSQGTGIWQIEPIGLGEADTKHVNPELCRGQLEFQAKIKMVGDKTGGGVHLSSHFCSSFGKSWLRGKTHRHGPSSSRQRR